MIDFRRLGTRLFLEHYQKLAISGFPHRHDFQPADVPKLLPHVAVVQLEGPEIARYRLAGTHIVRHLGLDPTGMNFFDLLPPELLERWVEHGRRCMEKPIGLRTLAHLSTEQGTLYEVENLVLPFANDTGKLGFFIGYLEFLEVIGASEHHAGAIQESCWDEIQLFD